MQVIWKSISKFVKEYYFFITYPLVSLFFHPKIYRNPHSKGTIILVTCWFNKNLYHNKWVSYLEKRGYKTYLWNMPLLFEDFPKTAERLDRLIKKYKLKNYTLVGISNGAVLALYYLQKYKKWNEIHRFISAAGPLHGTKWAYFFFFISKGRALFPENAFLQKLLQKPFPHSKMITLSASYDEFIPKKGNYIEGVSSYEVSVWGHNRFHLDCKKTYDLIAQIAAE